MGWRPIFFFGFAPSAVLGTLVQGTMQPMSGRAEKKAEGYLGKLLGINWITLEYPAKFPPSHDWGGGWWQSTSTVGPSFSSLAPRSRQRGALV